MRDTETIAALASMAIAEYNAERLGNGVIPLEHREIILDYVREDESAITDASDLAGLVGNVKSFIEQMAWAKFGDITECSFYNNAAHDREREDAEADFIAECVYFNFETGKYIRG